MYNSPRIGENGEKFQGCTERASTSLVDLETTVRNALKMTAVQSRYFKDLTDERSKILRVLIENDDGTGQNRIRRVSACCMSPHVMATQFGRPVLVVGRCKDRMCPRCSRFRAWQTAEKLHSIMKRMNTCRMITLTLKHRVGSLKGQIDRLMDGWKKIRKTDLWKDHVSGGTYSLEVTYDSLAKTWHPHLHIIAEGSYFDQKMLSGIWQKVTGDSPIVDIRAVHSKEKTARYVSKYVTKPAEVAGWDDAVLWEYMLCIKGRRMFHTFGSMHNVRVEDEREKIQQREGRGYIGIGQMIQQLNTGCIHAIALFEFLKFAPKSWRTAFGVEALAPGIQNSECDTMDAGKLDELLQGVTDQVNKPPPKEKTKKNKVELLWSGDDVIRASYSG